MIGLQKSRSFKSPLLKHQSMDKGNLSFNVAVTYQKHLAAGADRSLAGSLATKRLRTVALLGSGLIVLNLLVYGMVVAPAARRLAGDRSSMTGSRRSTPRLSCSRNRNSSLPVSRRAIPAQKDVPLLIKDLVQAARRLNLSVEAINSIFHAGARRADHAYVHLSRVRGLCRHQTVHLPG